MAKIVDLPPNATIRDLKGVLDFYDVRGQAMVRSWPQLGPGGQTPGSASTSHCFSYWSKLYKDLDPYLSSQLAWAAKTHDSWIGRDLWTAAIYGNVPYKPVPSYQWPPPGQRTQPCMHPDNGYWALLGLAAEASPFWWRLWAWGFPALPYLMLRASTTAPGVYHRWRMTRGLPCHLGTQAAAFREDTYSLPAYHPSPQLYGWVWPAGSFLPGDTFYFFLQGLLTGPPRPTRSVSPMFTFTMPTLPDPPVLPYPISPPWVWPREEARPHEPPPVHP